VAIEGLPILSWVGYRVFDGTAGTTGTTGTTGAGAGTSTGGGTGTVTEVSAAGSCPATTSGREVGDVVAALSFPTTDGGVFSVRDHCENELVVVYHYVDGCGSCAAFLAAEGNALADELASHGYRFVVAVARVNDLDGSSRAATVADAQRIEDELGLTTTVVADEGSTLISTFSRSGPSYLLALRRGNVIAQPWAGYGTRVPETVRALMSAIESE
jgi:peroxiredoxin